MSKGKNCGKIAYLIKNQRVEAEMQESKFNQLIDELLLTIEDAIDESGEDIDYDTVAGILTLEFSDQSKIIINRQVAMSQLWIAARSGGFHLDYIDGQWFCKTHKCNLHDLLNKVCSDQAQSNIHLTLD